MNNNREIIEEFIKKFVGSISENRNIAQKIISVNEEMVDAISDAKTQFPKWKLYMEVLIFKLILNSYSILKLSEGSKLIQNKNEIVVDYPSMYSLTRVILENFLTLNYIYMSKIPESEKIFRYKLWEVSGLITRQNFDLPKIESNLYEEALDTKKRESKIVEKILEEIEQMEEYKNITENDKRTFRNLRKFGKPRIDSWNNLIKDSELKENFFCSLYALFSSYAHSEFLGIYQLKHSLKPEFTSNSRLCIYIVQIINALVIDFLVNNFYSARIMYNAKSTSIMDEIELAIKLGRKTCP